MMRSTKLLGKTVFIKCPESQECGNWGVVVGCDGDNYHVAMNNGELTLIFARNEFVVREVINNGI